MNQRRYWAVTERRNCDSALQGIEAKCTEGYVTESVHSIRTPGRRIERRHPVTIDRLVFWACIGLMCAGFVLPGLGQIGASVLLIRG